MQERTHGFSRTHICYFSLFVYFGKNCLNGGLTGNGIQSLSHTLTHASSSQGVQEECNISHPSHFQKALNEFIIIIKLFTEDNPKDVISFWLKGYFFELTVS